MGDKDPDVLAYGSFASRSHPEKYEMLKSSRDGYRGVPTLGGFAGVNVLDLQDQVDKIKGKQRNKSRKRARVIPD